MYAAREHITARYGEDVLIAAVGDDGRVDEARVDEALAAATAEIDSYVAVRHTLPLSDAPAVLRQHCVDMAVYKMSAGSDTLTEEIKDRYRASVAWLKDLSMGRATLGTPAKPGQTSARPVVRTGPPRRFTRGQLQDL